MGQNRRSALRTRGFSDARWPGLKWLVVRDLAEIETATFWRDSPEVQSGELRPEAIQAPD